ncbi:hypothetical protein HOR19_gp36 [Phage MedPE-SWcel-C56]|uniref:Uncharacterized protein n=1 Tax=Phage MedPE-SWcel-C56 TaxID=1871314 RepID=A0A1B1IY25_9CAUD|nr:hypothetical protein HOR19_gp36 [Phage MedPE-SWcel-C56]ANS06229.1 hypothetical protein [Phage MedPE-SWcel-C56]
MAALTTIIAAAGLAASAGSAVSARKTAKKNRQLQENQLAQQKLEAKEAAALESKREDTGAKILIGTDETSSDITSTNSTATVKRKTGSPLGGLGAASRVGL